MTTGTNQFGHFLLTLLLLPILKASQPARVVVVSSEGHRYGIYNSASARMSANNEIAKPFFDDYLFEKNYTAMNAYNFSKLMICLFAVELNRRLQTEGCDITVNSIHPGVINTTNIQRSIAGKCAAYGMYCCSMSVCVHDG